jgi:hypothetical protein
MLISFEELKHELAVGSGEIPGRVTCLTRSCPPGGPLELKKAYFV